jgi:hypothetical protein
MLVRCPTPRGSADEPSSSDTGASSRRRQLSPALARRSQTRTPGGAGRSSGPDFPSGDRPRPGWASRLRRTSGGAVTPVWRVCGCAGPAKREPRREGVDTGPDSGALPAVATTMERPSRPCAGMIEPGLPRVLADAAGSNRRPGLAGTRRPVLLDSPGPSANRQARGSDPTSCRPGRAYPAHCTGVGWPVDPFRHTGLPRRPNKKNTKRERTIASSDGAHRPHGQPASRQPRPRRPGLEHFCPDLARR